MCEREKHTRTQLYVLFYYPVARVWPATDACQHSSGSVYLAQPVTEMGSDEWACVCTSPLNYTINCHRDNIVSSLERPSLISVEFFPRSYIFFNDVRDFFPAIIVYYVYKCPNLETIFFFFTWETCLDFNMCHPARGIVVYNWSRVLRQKIEITNPSVLCVHKRKNIYNTACDNGNYYRYTQIIMVRDIL